jgi:hypothetical protein
LLWIWESWLGQQRGEICNSDPETRQKYCATYNLVFVGLWHIGESLNYYAATIAAIATVFIAWFTLTLWITTRNLWKVTNRSVKVSEHALTEPERHAVVLCGGTPSPF